MRFDTQVRGSYPFCSSIQQGAFLRRLGALHKTTRRNCRSCLVIGVEEEEKEEEVVVVIVVVVV